MLRITCIARPRALRRRSAAIAWFFVLGYHLSFLHLLQPHTICWEHLELVESSDPKQAPQPPETHEGGSSSTGTSIRNAAARPEQQHEHCPIAIALQHRTGLVQFSPAALASLPSESSEPLSSYEIVLAASFPRHLL